MACCGWRLGEPLPLGPFLVGVAGLAVNTLFFLTLTLMLGVLTANRIALLGASLGLALLGFVVVPLGAAVSAWVMLTPFALIQRPAGRGPGGALAAVDLAAHRHHGHPGGHLCGRDPCQV